MEGHQGKKIRKPTLDKNGEASVLIGFRGTKDLKKQLVVRSKKVGLTYSRYLRTIVIDALSKGILR